MLAFRSVDDSSTLGGGPPVALLLDDDELWLRALSRVLTAEGLRCRCFTTPDKAIEAVCESPPDVFLIDFLLGRGWTGADVALQVHTRLVERAPLLVLVTGTLNQVSLEQRRLFDEVYGKDLSPRTLVDEVLAALATVGERARSQTRLRRLPTAVRVDTRDEDEIKEM